MPSARRNTHWEQIPIGGGHIESSLAPGLTSTSPSYIRSSHTFLTIIWPSTVLSFICPSSLPTYPVCILFLWLDQSLLTRLNSSRLLTLIIYPTYTPPIYRTVIQTHPAMATITSFNAYFNSRFAVRWYYLNETDLWLTHSLDRPINAGPTPHHPLGPMQRSFQWCILPWQILSPPRHSRTHTTISSPSRLPSKLFRASPPMSFYSSVICWWRSSIDCTTLRSSSHSSRPLTRTIMPFSCHTTTLLSRRRRTSSSTSNVLSRRSITFFVPTVSIGSWWRFFGALRRVLLCGTSPRRPGIKKGLRLQRHRSRSTGTDLEESRIRCDFQNPWSDLLRDLGELMMMGGLQWGGLPHEMVIKRWLEFAFYDLKSNEFQIAIFKIPYTCSFGSCVLTCVVTQLALPNRIMSKKYLSLCLQLCHYTVIIPSQAGSKTVFITRKYRFYSNIFYM